MRSIVDFDDFPLLTMKSLLAAKAFLPSRPKMIAFRHKNGTIRVIVNSNLQSILLISSTGNRAFAQQVQIGFRDLHFGRRRYFICPSLNREVSSLILYEDRYFVSRAAISGKGQRSAPMQRQRERFLRNANRLLGRDGRGPARGKNRDKLLTLLPDDAILSVFQPELAADIDAVRRQVQLGRRAALRFSLHGGPLSCRAGLAAGRPIYTLLEREAGVDTIGAEASPVARPKGIASIAAFPSISIRGLVEFKMLQPGETIARSLSWPGIDCFIEAHLEDPGAPYLLAHAGEWDGNFQIIRLATDGAYRRWYFLCPLTERRCSALFLREGRFASADGNRLRHPSQRKT